MAALIKKWRLGLRARLRNAPVMLRRSARPVGTRARKRTLLALLFLAVLAAEFGGMLESLDRVLLSWRFSMLPRAATGQLTVIEIDATTLADLGVWPFPRGHYARAVDQLVRAGVDTIAFDIDFSARTTPSADSALAEAIGRADRRVVLAAFAQHGAWSNSTTVLESKPSPVLGDEAHVAAVNITAEPDGRIWRYQILHTIRDGLRPSLAAMTVGGAFPFRDFLIDYGIRPASIRRISFQDVYNGRIEADQLGGARS